MKKFLFLAGICLSMSMALMAQDNHRRGGGRRMPFSIDAVVDTAVINHIGLEDAVLQQVYKLQETKMAEQREQMENGMRRERGQRPSEEELAAMREKRQAFTDQYRQQLRALIGDQLYITYLEKMLDRQATMRFNRMGGQRGGGQAFPQGGSGFGNDGFGGGGF